MSKKPETQIADKILRYIKTHGGDGYKVLGTAAQRGGEPDITGEWYSEHLQDWVHLKIEVKTSEGAATPRQLARVALYIRRGYAAGIARNVEDVLAIIAEYEEKHSDRYKYSRYADTMEIYRLQGIIEEAGLKA